MSTLMHMITGRGVLPLRELSIESQVSGILAQAVVRQVFANPLTEPLEATYIFPLPPEAAVQSFRIRCGERITEGKIDEREAARQRYEEAVAAGHLAAVTEEERPNVFTIRVGNVPPMESVEVELELFWPLEVNEEDEIVFRFPLVVAPRYIGGNILPDRVGAGVAPDTDRVPDGSRITPPRLVGSQVGQVQFRFRVHVDTGGIAPIQVTTPLIPCIVTNTDAGFDVVTNPEAVPDRDLVIRYKLPANELRQHVWVTPDPDKEEGTYMVVVYPPPPDPDQTPPRDVVVLVDCSGSMGGWKLDAAKQLTIGILSRLRPSDRVALVAFSSYPMLHNPGCPWLSLQPNLQNHAVQWVRTLGAAGGTELEAALLAAQDLMRSARPDAQRLILLITDAQVGSEYMVLRRAKAANARLCVLGVDTAPNTALMRQLARSCDGWYEVVEAPSRIKAALATAARRLAGSLSNGASVRATGVRLPLNQAVPRSIHTLTPGLPVVVLGRYRGNVQNASFELLLHHDGKTKSVPLAPTVVQGNAIPAAWARAMI